MLKAGGHGPAWGTVHAVDCTAAPAGAPVLTLEHALDVLQHPGTRLRSLCGAAAELDPVLKGFAASTARTDARAGRVQRRGRQACPV
ncbi:DUF6233 domain-containing protein [Streptomyces sp. 12297]